MGGPGRHGLASALRDEVGQAEFGLMLLIGTIGYWVCGKR